MKLRGEATSWIILHFCILCSRLERNHGQVDPSHPYLRLTYLFRAFVDRSLLGLLKFLAAPVRLRIKWNGHCLVPLAEKGYWCIGKNPTQGNASHEWRPWNVPRKTWATQFDYLGREAHAGRCHQNFQVSPGILKRRQKFFVWDRRTISAKNPTSTHIYATEDSTLKTWSEAELFQRKSGQTLKQPSIVGARIW